MQTGQRNPITSPSLLLRIRNREDVESWRTFETVYAPVIRGYCRRRGFQSCDIDDIVQEVMASVARAIVSFDYQPHKGRFRSWLATITANKLRNFVAKSKYEQAVLTDIVEQLAVSPEEDSDWSEVFIQQLFSAACQRIRHRVEPATWLCFQKTWLDGSPATSVAKELGLTIGNVYVNKSRVLKQLEQEFLVLTDDFPGAENSNHP